MAEDFDIEALLEAPYKKIKEVRLKQVNYREKESYLS